MTGFSGGKIPPKFAQFDRPDLGPYYAEIETFISKLYREVALNEDERIRSVLREAFEAGADYALDYYERIEGDPTPRNPNFEGWLAGFITKQQEAGK